MFGIKIKNNKLNKLKINLYENGIENRTMFPPITYHKHYQNLKCDISNSKILHENCIILPSYPELNHQEINYICNTIKKIL